MLNTPDICPNAATRPDPILVSPATEQIVRNRFRVKIIRRGSLFSLEPIVNANRYLCWRDKKRA